MKTAPELIADVLCERTRVRVHRWYALQSVMHGVQVISEEECQRGWKYAVRIVRDGGESSEHAVRLDWAEHEHWCGGRCPPSRVVEVLLGFVLEQDGQRELPPKFDAATVRRWWPEVDQVIPGRL